METSGHIYVNKGYTGLAAATWDIWRDDTASWPDRHFFKEIIDRFGEPALDIGCSTGRLLLDYLHSGIDIDGVDVSPEMLAICRVKADRLGLSPHLYLQSMAALDLPRKYRTILVPSSSLQLLTDPDTVQAAMQGFYAHLESGGVLAASFFYEWEEGDPLETEWQLVFAKSRTEDGATVRRWIRERYEAESQLWHSEDRYEVERSGDIVSTEHHRQSPEGRWYTKKQAVGLFQDAGFVHIKIFSEFTNQPVHESDKLFTVLGRRP